MATRPERRRRRWWCCLFLFVCAAVVTPRAREYTVVEIESLKVTLDTDWATRAAPGYLPVRFDITNLGDARVIEIVGQASRFFRPPRVGNGAGFVRQVVRMARGDRVRLTIPVPIFADNESIRFEIHEGDRTIQRFNFEGFQSGVAPADASTVIVAEPASAFSDIASRLPRPIAGRSGGGRAVMDILLDPSRLPASWLGFTSLRAVVIGPTEWAQLSDGQKSALLTWTACGGDLIFADGDLAALLPSARGEAASGPDRVVARHLFGRIHVLTSKTLAKEGLAGLLSAVDVSKAHDTFWALPANTAPDWGAIEARGFRLRIPGIDGVPARVYLSILLLFSLLIGPANYWLLWRKRRQVLLVLTAPLISAVFIVLLAGYAVAGEGFRVQGRAMTFTMLDQAAKQAVTRASVSLYSSGMTPGGGLRFSRDVAVFPIGVDGTGTRNRLNLDLTDAQQFTAGVLQARAPTNFEQVAVRSARERLTFTHESGGLSVTNGLEASVLMLLYRDGDTLYRAEGALAPGGKQTLRAGALNALPALPVSIAAKFLDLLQNQPRGSYLAVLDRSPFWESGLSSLVERGSAHLVLGWPEGQQ